MTEGQQFGGGMVAGVADAVAGLPAADRSADGDDGSRRAVSGREGEFPVGQVGVLEPLVRAGVDGQLGAGADGADLGCAKDLVVLRRRKSDLADLDLEGLTDDDLACAHGGSERWVWAGNANMEMVAGREATGHFLPSPLHSCFESAARTWDQQRVSSEMPLRTELVRVLARALQYQANFARRQPCRSLRWSRCRNVSR